MKKRPTLFLIGRIRESMNEFLKARLEHYELKGIVPSHGEILMILYRNKSAMPLKEIAERIHRTQPTVTVLVKKLEKLGYIRRYQNSDDKRSTCIDLTDRGKKIQEIFETVSDEINSKLHSALTEKEADTLDALLHKVLQNL